MIRSDALRLLEELTELAKGGGWANTDALRQMRAKLRLLEAAAARGYTREKIASANNWAEILFSDRRHERWRAGAHAGHVIVRQHLRGDIFRMRSAIADDPGFLGD